MQYLNFCQTIFCPVFMKKLFDNYEMTRVVNSIAKNKSLLYIWILSWLKALRDFQEVK